MPHKRDTGQRDDDAAKPNGDLDEVWSHSSLPCPRVTDLGLEFFESNSCAPCDDPVSRRHGPR